MAPSVWKWPKPICGLVLKLLCSKAFKALGKDDPELTAIVLDELRDEGLDIREQTMVTSIEKRGKTGVKINLKLQDGEGSVDGSDVLVATGRAVNVNGLGLGRSRD